MPDLKGQGVMSLTFKIDNTTITYDPTKPNGSAQAGLAVTTSPSDETINLALGGTDIVGKLISVDADGYGSVEVEGVIVFKFSSPSVAGSRIAGGGTSGYVTPSNAVTARGTTLVGGALEAPVLL